MNVNLENYIKKKYEKILDKNFSIHCFDGWYHLIDKLLFLILKYKEKENYNIKIYKFSQEEGLLKTYINSNAYEEINSLIFYNYEMSKIICEKCAKNATLLFSKNSWNSLCGDHLYIKKHLHNNFIKEREYIFQYQYKKNEIIEINENNYIYTCLILNDDLNEIKILNKKNYNNKLINLNNYEINNNFKIEYFYHPLFSYFNFLNFKN